MDGLLLNISAGDEGPQKKVTSRVKGGRWTDRVKAKKNDKKRKSRDEDEGETRGEKRVLNSKISISKKQKTTNERATRNDFEVQETDLPKAGNSRPSNTIISSLFTSNPNIADITHKNTVLPALPTNAPLKDSSSFSDLGLDPLLVSHLEHKLNILKPTAIQRASIPYMTTTDPSIANRDIFLQSQTGSGKTLSFLLPIIQDRYYSTNTRARQTDI